MEIRVKNVGNYLPFISGSGDIISGDATSGNTTSGCACAHDHFR